GAQQPQGGGAARQPPRRAVGRGRAGPARSPPAARSGAVRAPRGLPRPVARERAAPPGSPGRGRRGAGAALRSRGRRAEAGGRTSAGPGAPAAVRAALAHSPAPRLTGILVGLGLAAAAGLNAWLILLLFNGLYLLLPLEFPGPPAAWLSSHGVLTAAVVLFLLEFVADKIPVGGHLLHL